MLMDKLKKIRLRLPVIINTVFALVFFVHSTMIGFGIMYPDEPNTKLFTKNFSDLNVFPLNFKICLNEITNSNDRYSKLGYENIWAFYQGTALTYPNRTWAWVGWGGHSKNNSTISNAEGKIWVSDSVSGYLSLYKKLHGFSVSV